MTTKRDGVDSDAAEQAPAKADAPEAYEATETIIVDGFPGYQPGHRVPTPIVKRLGLLDKGQVQLVEAG